MKYSEQITTSPREHAQWIEICYVNHKIRPGNLGLLLRKFDDWLTVNEKQHKSLKEYKAHFYRWLSSQERNYPEHFKIGML